MANEYKYDVFISYKRKGLSENFVPPNGASY